WRCRTSPCSAGTPPSVGGSAKWPSTKRRTARTWTSRSASSPDCPTSLPAPDVLPRRRAGGLRIPPRGTLGSMSQAHEITEEDPHRWLEDVTGTAALDWVRERNADSLGGLASGPRFTSLQTEIREVLDADDRIPFVRRRGAY